LVINSIPFAAIPRTRIGRGAGSTGGPMSDIVGSSDSRNPARRTVVTDEERQKAEALISRLEIAVGEIFPRDGANAGLIASMIQSLNGLRSVLGLVRPH
jgi:hypothetical protein